MQKKRQTLPKKKTGNKLYVGVIIFQILFNFVLMFLRQRKKKKGGKIDTAEKMKEGLNPTLKKEPAKDIVWKV